MGTLITASMMGGLALLLADLTKKQYIVQRKAETQLEVSSLMSRMFRTLYRGKACNHTLGVGQSINNGRDIDFIKDKDGNSVLNTTDKYGNGLLMIESMTLTNTRITGTSGEVTLKVVLEKQSKAIKGSNKVVRTLPLSVEVSPGTTNMLNCHYTGEDLAQIATGIVTNDIDPLATGKANGAKQSICVMMGGTYNASSSPPCSFSGTLSSQTPPLLTTQHYVPPIVETPEPCFCDKDESICAPITDAGSDLECGIKQGSNTGNPVASITNACYLRDPSHTYQTGSSSSSCADAKNAAIAAADPNNWATTSSSRLPLGHHKGKIYCDPGCSPNGPTSYQIGCRLYVRGVFWRCPFTCRQGNC